MGSQYLTAALKGAEGSIATTLTRRRHHFGFAASHWATAVDDVDHRPGVEVDHGGHPRLNPLPDAGVLVLVPPDGAEAVLIDSEMPDQPGPVRAGLLQPGGRVTDHLLDRGPRHTELVRHPRHGTDLAGHSVGDRLPQPPGEAGTRWDLLGVFGERRARTQGLGAAPPFLDPLNAHVTVEGDVLEALPGALMNPGGVHPTLRARSLHRGRRNHHQAVAVAVAVDAGHVVVGEVEKHRGYRRARVGRRLGHARGPVLLDVW